MKKWTSRLLVVFAVPLGSQQLWVELPFRKITPNRVEYDADRLTIQVDSSASPLVYKFESIKRISAIEADLEIKGEIQALKSWKEFEEDSYLRVGLVAEGPKKLSGLAALFSPNWVKKMFSLAPKGKGLDKIYFFNVTTKEELVGKTRSHPLSEYMNEENVIAAPKAGRVHFRKKLAKPMDVAGVWLSSDGDDSKSKFTVILHKLTVE